MRSQAFLINKRALEITTYSAVAAAVVISASVSPMGNGLALLMGIGSFMGLAAVGSVLPSHLIAKAALISVVWASVYGLKSAGVPLLEIPVFLAVVGLGLAIAHRHGQTSQIVPGVRRSRVSKHWNIWRSHFKTAALVTMAFSALSVAIFWVLEGAGLDNVLPIIVTAGLATLGLKYATARCTSDQQVAGATSSTVASVRSFFWIFMAAAMFSGIGAIMLFGSHQGVVRAMDTTLRSEDPDELQTNENGITSTIDFDDLEGFTSHPWNEDCMPDDTGVRYCDPVNLVFVGQTLDEVKLSLLAEGWITSSRRGSDQYLRWGSQEYHRHDLQLHFYESLRARYHVRLWESPDKSIVVGAVHHESGVIHHTIDIAWDDAQQFVEDQLCDDQCGTSPVLSQHSPVQGETDLWRGMTNDGRVSIISVSR